MKEVKLFLGILALCLIPLKRWKIILILIFSTFSVLLFSVKKMRKNENISENKSYFTICNEESLFIKYRNLSTRDTVQMVFDDWIFFVDSNAYLSEKVEPYFYAPHYAPDVLRLETKTSGLPIYQKGYKFYTKEFDIYLKIDDLRVKTEVLEKLSKLLSSTDFRELQAYFTHLSEDTFSLVNHEIGYRIDIQSLKPNEYCIRICNGYSTFTSHKKLVYKSQIPNK